MKYVLKNKNGLYYSDDRAFIEPNKKFAKKMNRGQAENIMRYENGFSRYHNQENICIMELVD